MKNTRTKEEGERYFARRNTRETTTHDARRTTTTDASERATHPFPFPFPFPSKIRGTMPRVIYPALKEARHPGYKRDNKEY